MWRGRSRVSERTAVALVAILALALAAIPFLLNHRAYYHDDMQSYFAPALMAIGRSLARGVWPALTLQVGNGGALLAEYQYGLLNPVSLASYLAISRLNDLAAAAAALATIHYVILALGVFTLARSLQASRPFSVLTALAFVSNNYLFYWFSSAWWPGMVGTTWLVWATVFLLQASSGRWMWLGAAVASFLTLTSGWPHAVVALGAIATLIAVVRASRGGAMAATPAVSALVVASVAALPAILPLLAMNSVTNRVAEMRSDAQMIPDFYSVLAVSSPAQFGHFRVSDGADMIATPVFLAAWYVLPITPFINWCRVSRRGQLTVVAGTALAFAAATQGPGAIGMLITPIRFLPYAHLSLLLAFALAASDAGFVITFRRIALCFGLIMVGLIMSIQVQPALAVAAAAATALVSAFVWLAIKDLVAGSPKGVVALGVGVALIFVLTHLALPFNQNLGEWGVSSAVRSVDSLDAIPNGYVLTIGRKELPIPSRVGQGAHYANMLLVDGEANAFGYSPIGYRGMANAFCIEYAGQVCNAGLYRLKQYSGLGSASWLDLLKIDSIRFINNSHASTTMTFDKNWRCAPAGISVTCQRSTPRREMPGSVAYLSEGLVARESPGSVAWKETLNVERWHGGGDVIVFNRFAWPGYHARLDNRKLPVAVFGPGLLAVNIPHNVDAGTLEVTYLPPYFPWSLAAFTMAVLATVSILLAWPRQTMAAGRKAEIPLA